MSEEHARRERLKRAGALHPQPETVSAELVAQSAFFDAHDLVQMKYEMLRSVSVDGASVSEAARAFGLSRVAFYRAYRQYQEEGLAGLLPQKRGPHGPHKLLPPVIQLVRAHLADMGSTPNWEALSSEVTAAFGISIHPRTLARTMKDGRGGD